MRIATFNVNGLRARQEFLLHWLRAREPDVVALQDEHFPHEAISAAGYHAVCHGQQSWNGVAILSREPAHVVQRGLPGQEAMGARLLTAEVAGLRFSSVYGPNGKHVGHADFPRKLAFFETLAKHLAEQPDGAAPRVVAGDLNVCPGALDSWNEVELRGRIFHTDVEREGFQRLLAAGLHDLFRERHPDAQVFSWWDYRAGAFHRGHGLRIDFLLGSAAVLERVRDVWIDRDYRKKKDGLTASDHAPVIADLE